MNTPPLPYQSKNRPREPRIGGRPLWKSVPFWLAIAFALCSFKSFFGDERVKLTVIGGHDLTIYWGGPDRLSLGFGPSNPRDLSAVGWQHFPRMGGAVSMTQWQFLGGHVWANQGSLGLQIPLSSSAVLFFAVAWLLREKPPVSERGIGKPRPNSETRRRWAIVLFVSAGCLMILSLWSSRQAISIRLAPHSKLVTEADSFCILPYRSHSQHGLVSVTAIDWTNRGVYFACKPVYFSFCGIFAGALNDWKGSASVFVLPISLVAVMFAGWAVWLLRMSTPKS